MYRTTRKWHRAVGFVVAVFLLTISATGFLLATKGTFGWVRPPELKGAPLGELAEVVSVQQAARAAFDLGIPELRSHEDIDRIDYRPGKNHFKIVS